MVNLKINIGGCKECKETMDVIYTELKELGEDTTPYKIVITKGVGDAWHILYHGKEIE